MRVVGEASVPRLAKLKGSGLARGSAPRTLLGFSILPVLWCRGLSCQSLSSGPYFGKLTHSCMIANKPS